MNRYLKWTVAVVAGIVYMILAILLAQWLLQGLGTLVGYFGGVLGLEQEVTQHLAQSLGQLQSARIRMPWAIGLLTGGAIGGLYPFLCRRRWVRITWIVLAAVFFLPIMLGFLCLAEVNDIALVQLLRSILPILPALL